MKILSSIQNNLSGNFFREQKDQSVKNNSEMNNDLMIAPEKNIEKKETEKILSNNEKNTLHLFFGTQIPDDMKIYGQNNIKQINKGQLLDLRG